MALEGGETGAERGDPAAVLDAGAPGQEQSSRDHRPLAVVLGNTNLIRALGLAGIRSASVTRPGRPMAHSRFVASRVEWADNWGDPDGLLANLQSFGAQLPERPPLFYQHDGDLAFVSRNRAALERHFRFVIGEPECVEQLLDKTLFSALAERLSLPVPRTTVLRPEPGTDPPELPLDYPVIIKPLTRRDTIWKLLGGESKALRLNSWRELRELWPILATGGFQFVAQELVPGDEDHLESYHVYVDERGEVAGEFTGRKVRTLPREFGQTTALTITDESDVREAGRHCMATLGLRGVAKIDYKRAPSGELLLLEVNPRFSLWLLPGAVAGVNLPALVYADLMDLPRPPASRARAGVRWTVPWLDLRAARERSMSLARWAAWQLACETRHVVALDDPMPFLRGLAWPGLKRRLRLRR